MTTPTKRAMHNHFALWESRVTGISGITVRPRMCDVHLFDGQTIKLPTKFLLSHESAADVLRAVELFQKNQTPHA